MKLWNILIKMSIAGCKYQLILKCEIWSSDVIIG